MINRLLSTKGQGAVGLIVVLVIVLALIGMVVTVTYNGLVVAEKSVEEARAQIATVCQRRLDLIPNLIEIVKGYAEHERETLTAITKARTAAEKAVRAIEEKRSEGEMAQVAATQAGLTSAMRGIFALVENYPQLLASSHFMVLQDQYEGTENRINVARQRYNSAVKHYNTKIMVFPGIVVAPAFGFQEKESFEAQVEAQKAVKVKF